MTIVPTTTYGQCREVEVGFDDDADMVWQHPLIPNECRSCGGDMTGDDTDDDGMAVCPRRHCAEQWEVDWEPCSRDVCGPAED